MTERVVYTTIKPQYIVQEACPTLHWDHEAVETDWVAVAGFDDINDAMREADGLRNGNLASDYRLICTE